MNTPLAKVPDIIVSRLPVYLRALQRMADAGVINTSSQELGEKVGISAAQIRKDLSQFGEFGKQGTGYNVGYLQNQIARILQVDHEWQVALIGVGDLGRALARYGGFAHRGFRIVALFDNDPAKIGSRLGELDIMSLERLPETVRGKGIRLAMLTVPVEAAQQVTDQCVKAGIDAILNYAPITLRVPEGVRVQHIDPVAHLQRMTYYL